MVAHPRYHGLRPIHRAGEARGVKRRDSISRVVAALVGVVPTAAFAQATTPAAARAEALARLALAGAIVLSVLAVGVGLLLYWRGRRRAVSDRRRIRELFGTPARTTAVLDAAPAGFFEWSALSGLETCSSGLAHSLGASPVAVKTFRDLSPYFSESDFAGLEVAVDALRAERKPFDRVVRAKNGRVLEACGRVVFAAGTGEPLSFTLWFHDATAFAGDVAVGQAAVAATAAERDRLAEILDLAPFPAWRRGSDLRIAWVNRAYAAAVEADVASIVRNSVEFVPAPARSSRAPSRRWRARPASPRPTRGASTSPASAVSTRSRKRRCPTAAPWASPATSPPGRKRAPSSSATRRRTRR